MNPITEHENYLYETVPYTPAEKEAVSKLFILERKIISDYTEGRVKNHYDALYEVSKRRRTISRAARDRA